jgi:Las17-binding protein actin regulator
LDGSVVIERNDENERFYGRKISAAQLIRGEVPRPRGGGRGVDRLVAAIEMAEGRMVQVHPFTGMPMYPVPGPSGKPVEKGRVEKGALEMEKDTEEPPPPEYLAEDGDSRYYEDKKYPHVVDSDSKYSREDTPSLPPRRRSGPGVGAVGVLEQQHNASSSRSLLPVEESGSRSETPPLPPRRRTPSSQVQEDKSEELYEDAPPQYDEERKGKGAVGDEKRGMGMEEEKEKEKEEKEEKEEKGEKEGEKEGEGEKEEEEEQ